MFQQVQLAQPRFVHPDAMAFNADQEQKRRYWIPTEDSLPSAAPVPKKRRVEQAPIVSLPPVKINQGWWKFGEYQKDVIRSLRQPTQQVTTPAISNMPISETYPGQVAQPFANLEGLLGEKFNARAVSYSSQSTANRKGDSCTWAGSESEVSVAEGSNTEEGLKFRVYQAENWTERFEELLEFRAQIGHCLVPNNFPANQPLAQWVKRQRYQFKLKQQDKRSSMSDERMKALDEIGFVWDSHSACWDERLEELMQYKQVHGHCNVPSRHTANRQMAVWVKRQRRQYKFYCEDKPSSMTTERIAILEGLGFEWDLRTKSED